MNVGSRVTGVNAIAGAGTGRRIKSINYLANDVVPGSKASDWQQLRGTATVNRFGFDEKAELHWFSMVGDSSAYIVHVKRCLR